MYALFPMEKYQGKKICVALSGGLDSVCLLHAFRHYAEKYDILLTAAHLEHGIRGEESLRDLKFCEDLCKEWGIELISVRVPIPFIAKGSGRCIEEVARETRYGFFQSIMESGKADFVATAHHMNDVAETILFRLSRGTALAGMHGITEHDGFIRPMLHITRKELEYYAEINNLPHVDDSTNDDETYARNRIRHSVLPALLEVNERAVEHIARFASLSAADDDFLQALADEKVVRRAGECAVPLDLPDPLFLRASIISMKECGMLKDYTYEQLSGVMRLRELQSGKRVKLSCGGEAVREYGHIVFFRPCVGKTETEIPFSAQEGEYDAPVPFSVTGEKKGASKTELCVDLDAFPEGCVVRSRRKGDYIVPCNGQKKTLKKFLTGRKISARRGRDLPLVAKDSEVLVVVGVEISDKVKITDKTVRRGYIC